MKKISFIFGTRPEAIKLCPLVLKVASYHDLESHVCITGQHREMLQQVLDLFGIKPDADLQLMLPNQTLSDFTSRAISALNHYLANEKPDMVIIQGDTTTAFCAALCAFYHKIPISHVEAGLRTWNRWSPFPEEINRTLISHLADMHFAPTGPAKKNLIREGVAKNRIFVTGNTVVDALFLALEKVKRNHVRIEGLPEILQPNFGNKAPMVLITGHRRENFGKGFENICLAISDLAKRFPDVHFVYPVHLNPNVREPVKRIIGGSQQANIHLVGPASYLSFVGMMNRACIIMTDSGGVQEEAPSLGKPVLLMRDTTERPEGVEMGTVKLVGTDRETIFKNVSSLLRSSAVNETKHSEINPYGDGNACERICKRIKAFIGV